MQPLLLAGVLMVVGAVTILLTWARRRADAELGAVSQQWLAEHRNSQAA